MFTDSGEYCVGKYRNKKDDSDCCTAEVNNILDLDRKLDIVVNANVKHVKYNKLMLKPIKKKKNQSDFCKAIEVLYTTINLLVLVWP